MSEGLSRSLQIAVPLPAAEGPHERAKATQRQRNPHHPGTVRRDRAPSSAAVRARYPAATAAPRATKHVAAMLALACRSVGQRAPAIPAGH